MPLNELTFDRPSAPSPFGEDVTFPMQGVAYIHPERDRGTSPEDH